MRIISSVFVLPVALGIYLLLALAGIHYGLPHQNHPLSYAPDETTWLEAVSQIKPHEGKYNPHPKLAHPTLYLEVYGATLAILSETGWIARSQGKEWFRSHPDQFARIYLAGRYLQVAFGMLLLGTLWAIARLTLNSVTAGMSVLLLAVTPSLVAASHFSQANIPVCTLAFIGLAALLMHERDHTQELHWLFIAAFFIGLAVSTKYSALPLCAPLGYWMLYQKPKKGIAIGGAIGLLLFGFFLGSPFAFLSPSTFWPAFQRFTGLALIPIKVGLVGKLIYPFTHAFRFAMGISLEIASLLAMVWYFLKVKFSPTFALWIPAFYAGTVMAGFVASSGRVLILIPTLVLLTGKMTADLTHIKPWLGGSLFLMLLCCTSLPSLAIVSLHRQEPIQKNASQWIEDHIPAGSSIGIPREIFWWTPPVIYVSADHPERIEHPYRVSVLHFSMETAQQQKTDYILLSGPERTNEGMQTPETRQFLAWLDSGTMYRPITTISRTVGFGSWKWNRPELPLYTDDDLWSPSEELYQRIIPTHS